MSYKIKDKVYSENPLLDSIVYNVKKMAQGVILKDQEEADKYETEDSIHQAEIYCSIHRGLAGFNLFAYDAELLSKLKAFNSREIMMYVNDNSLIPFEYRDKLVKLASERFLNNYEETNNYYRCMCGLPDYGTENLYLTKSMVPQKYRRFVDFSTPVHEFSDYKIGMLERCGALSNLQKQYPNLKYLWHLGAKRVELYKARIAENFEVLYVPEAEDLIRNRFKEVLEKTRVVYLKRFYSQAYKFNGDYYDKFMIIMIICQAVTDMIAETPEWYIRRDVFDLRTVEYILTANGVKFFPQIPLKYQLSLVRILNKVVKYKSCNKNIFDLASIFAFDNINVYKHYLMKRRLIDSQGDYVTEKKVIQPDPFNPVYTEIVDDVEKMYELLFIRTPVDDTYDNYINDNINRSDYDVVTIDDPWWDGTDDHEYIKGKILEKDFTIQATKYLSFEAQFDISDYEFQIMYFLNLILNVDNDTSKLLVNIPVISDISKFELRDIFLLLYLISFNYYDPATDDTIKNTNRDFIRPIEFKGDDYEPDRLMDYTADGTPEHIYLCNGGRSRITTTINVNGGYSWDESEYDPEQMPDTDGMGSLEYDFRSDCDGGYAYSTDPMFKNASGSNSDFILDHDDSEDVIGEDDVLDFDGSVSFGFDNYEDADGGKFNTNDEDYDYYMNGGHVINSYFNYKSGNGYFDNVAKYFEEDFDKPRLPQIDMSNRLYGFNIHADLDYLAEVIGYNHPRFGYARGYTLEDLGVEGFITVKDGKINSADALMKIYKENKKAYDNLLAEFPYVDSQSDYEIYEFVYHYLFTVEMNQDYFTLSDGTTVSTYKEYIENRDPVLLEFFEMMMMEEELETRQYYMSEYVDSIISTLEKYLNCQDMLKYIFIFLPSVNWNTLLEYLALLVNFFKSYKAQFMEIGATLMFNHSLDNKIYMMDDIKYKDVQLEKTDTVNFMDRLECGVLLEPTDYADISDKIQIYPEYEACYYDFNGGQSKSRLYYEDVEGNPYTTWNGNSSKSNGIRYSEWDGGYSGSTSVFSMNGYNAKDFSQYVEPMDIDGGIARFLKRDNTPLDLSESEDVEDWDGGTTRHFGNEKKYNAGTSNINKETAFIDVTGGDRRNITGVNFDYKEIYDWDGGTSEYYGICEDISGGPAKTQLFYADYMSYETWDEILVENPEVLAYNPHYDGLNMDGGESDSSEKDYNYYSDAEGARIKKSPIINIDGDLFGSRVRETASMKLIKNGIRDFDGRVKLHHSIDNALHIEYDGLYVDGNMFVNASELLNFNKDFTKFASALSNRIDVLDGYIFSLNNFDIEGEILAYIKANNIDTTVAELVTRVENIELAVENIVPAANVYTDTSLTTIWGSY